jgi:hypothetical protein
LKSPNVHPGGYIVSDNRTPKPENVDYFRVPRPPWRRLLPKEKAKRHGGRPRADERAVVNGIWYVLWAGCQWKAVHRDWLGYAAAPCTSGFRHGNGAVSF